MSPIQRPRHKSSLSGVDHMLRSRPKSGCQRLGQQVVIAVEEGDGAVAVQRGSGALALVQQGDNPPGSWRPVGWGCAGSGRSPEALPAVLGKAGLRNEYRILQAVRAWLLPRAEALRAERNSARVTPSSSPSHASCASVGSSLSTEDGKAC